MAGRWWLPRWWLYRPVMRLAHRFNWHWMPPIYPERDTQLWCQWCGARYTLPKPSSNTLTRTPPHE
jgi:hypothetical protein